MGRLGMLLCVGMLALFGTVYACYSPPNPACGFLCNSANNYACPEEYSCSHADGVCVSNTASSTKCYSDAAPAPEGIDADTTAPHVVSTSPITGDINVAREMPITIQFDRPTVGVNLNNVQILDGATPLAFTFSISSPLLTLTPTVPLPGGTVIQVKLGSGITSITGSPLSPYEFSFTTIDDEPPMLVTSLPLDMATMVDVTSTIAITFSEPVANVSATSFTVFDGATQITGTIVQNLDADHYTFTPDAALPAASTITVILTAAITDLAVPANSLAPVSYSFATQ